MSSFFDEASLVMIPSGYKNQKVYSIKPLDGAGDLAFSRASNATRVASNGYIEKVRTNLILQSQAFNTTWSAISSSVSANTTANPLDGAVNADTITLTGGTAQKFVAQASLQNGLYTYSVYAKAGTHNFIQLMLGSDSGVYANFNISTGAVTLSAGCVASVVSAGNGWYRCSIAYSTTTADNVFVLAVDSGTDNRFAASSSTGTFILFGAQVEVGDIATDYIPTTSAAVSVGPVSGLPRLDYLGSTCPRLLLEPQRTNLYNYSEQLNQWLTSSATVTANYAVSPDGYTNADRVQFAAGGLVYVSGTGSAGENTLSVYAKATNGTSAKFRFFANGAVTYSSDQTATGEWQRFTFTYTYSAVTAGLSVATTGADDVIFYGFQHEVGAYATSYIPTLGSSVTRVADACSKTGISSLIGQTEGTLFYEFSVPVNESVTRAITVNDGTVSNRINISTFGGSLFARVDVGGVNQVNSSATIVPTNMNKVAFRYKANDFAAYVNGVKVITDTSGTTYSGTTLSNFAFIQPDATSPFNGAVKQILFFKTGLTDAQLSELTSL